ncbi:MAG: class I SAM-dependent methyltransferase [Candidatus Paceibacterota bacterium]
MTMMFKGKNIFNASFDVYADNYHSVRPGYPVALFSDIKEQCGIDGSSRLMEIGAGSGIATIELAKLGCHIVAIEPGARLAAIAREQTSSFKNVEIIEDTFENFRVAEKFDAILAFTAFHWLSEGDKFKQVSDVLNKSGHLILVWNSFFQDDSSVTAEINNAYHEFLPDVYPDESTVNNVNEGVLLKLNHREQEVVANPLFYPIYLRKYLTVYNYDDQTYPKLLNTFPKIVEVEEEKRSRFFGHISEIVKRHGAISVPVLTTLIICQRRNHFLEVVTNSKGGL